MLDKQLAKELQEGFIPDGEKWMNQADLKNLKFRRTTEEEVRRCCARVGKDPQSGPIFCGRLAEYVAFREENGETFVIALCGRGWHTPPKECVA